MGKNCSSVGDYCDFSKIWASDKMDPNHKNVLDQKWLVGKEKRETQESQTCWIAQLPTRSKLFLQMEFHLQQW